MGCAHVFWDKVLGSRCRAAAQPSQGFGNGSAAPRSPCKRHARGPSWRGHLLISVWRLKFIVSPDFSDRFWLSQSGREGICVCARAAPAALRGWTGNLGQSLYVTGSISLRIFPLQTGCWMSASCRGWIIYGAKSSSDPFHRHTKQTMGRVSETAWGESGDFLHPHGLL